MVVTLVLARMQLGMIEASTTRRFCRPCTRPKLIHHRHGVRGWPHLAGAGDVLTRGHFAQEILVQGLVSGQLGVGGLDALFNYIAEALVFGELHAGAHHLAHAPAVEFVFEVAVFELRLHIGVRRLQP